MRRKKLVRLSSSSSLRVGLLKSAINKLGLDGFLVMRATSIRYFTEFDGGVALLVPSSGNAILLVSRMNLEMAEQVAKNCEVRFFKRGGERRKAVSQLLVDSKLKEIGFDTLDAETYIQLKKKIVLEPKPDVVWDLRRVKGGREIRLIRRAAGISDRGMRVAAEVIKPRIREYEVAAEIEHAMRKLGS
ncbi:MAG: M24 family metallopeptidase, partial [Candidatus Bathyarchaeia archaeon]